MKITIHAYSESRSLPGDSGADLVNFMWYSWTQRQTLKALRFKLGKVSRLV